jgi:hypothetical protein
MKKQPTKKLVLSKESLLLLEDDGLKKAAGGDTLGDSLCIAKTCNC